MLGPSIRSILSAFFLANDGLVSISSISLLLSAMKLQVALCLLSLAFAFACLRNLCNIDSTSLKWHAGQPRMSYLSSIQCPMCLPGFGSLLRLSRDVTSKCWMLWLQDLVPTPFLTFCSAAPWGSVCQCFILSPCCLLVSPSSNLCGAGAGVCMTTSCFPVAGCMCCMGGRAKNLLSTSPNCDGNKVDLSGGSQCMWCLQWCSILELFYFLQEDSVVTSTRSWRCLNLTRLMGKQRGQSPLRSVSFMTKKVD